MITKTTVKALVAGGSVLATWFAVGPTHPAPSTPAASSQRPAATREISAEELNAEATKLRAHVSGQLRQSTRNPFRFGTSKPATPHAGSSLASRAPTIPLVSASTPIAPSYTLAGIGERNTPEDRKRTAVISGEGQLYLVAEGEMVGGRYTVVRIDPEAVLLRDQTGAELTLVLR